MIFKVAMPGKIQFKMIHKENALLHKKNEIFYFGGALVLPPPLELEG